VFLRQNPNVAEALCYLQVRLGMLNPANVEKSKKMGEESEKWQQTGRKGSFEHFRRKKMMRYWIGMFNVAAK